MAPPQASEGELEALVRLTVTERPVEPVCFGPLLVGGELGKGGAAGTAALVGVLHQLPANALSADGCVDANGLDEEPGRAVAGDARDVGQLRDGDDPTIRLGDDELVVRTRLDRIKAPQVCLAEGPGPLGGDAVVGDQVDDPLEVLAAGGAEDERHRPAA